MFIQVIEGKVADRAGIARQMDRWIADVQPGAAGYLGSTGGITADGRSIMLARFDSAAAAQANSERPEQGAWWTEMEKCFDGPVTFHDSSDVDEFRGGGSDDAGFVQIMKATDIDAGKVRALDERFEQIGDALRPDLLGIVRVWTAPGDYVEAAYFRSEAEARAGEQGPMPPEVEEAMSDFQELLGNIEFYDLPEPMLNSA